MPEPSGSGTERRPEPGWYVEAGAYRIVVARSAAVHESVTELVLSGDEVRLQL